MTPAQLVSRYEAMSPDEREVIDLIFDGVENGHVNYGPLTIGSDGRDFESEAIAEHRDAIFYLTVETLARRRRGR